MPLRTPRVAARWAISAQAGPGVSPGVTSPTSSTSAAAATVPSNRRGQPRPRPQPRPHPFVTCHRISTHYTIHLIGGGTGLASVLDRRLTVVQKVMTYVKLVIWCLRCSTPRIVVLRSKVKGVVGSIDSATPFQGSQCGFGPPSHTIRTLPANSREVENPCA
jgi:hypothetical protein